MGDWLLDHFRMTIGVFSVIAILSATLLVGHFYLINRHAIDRIESNSLTACYNSNLSRLQTDSTQFLLFESYEASLKLDKTLVKEPQFQQLYTPAQLKEIFQQGKLEAEQLVLIAPIQCTPKSIRHYTSPEPVYILDLNGKVNPHAVQIITQANKVLHSPNPGATVRRLYR